MGKQRGPKGRRPRGPHRGPRPGPGGRTPPPEATGLEGQYIKRLKDAATPLRLILVDGTEVRGHIEYYDRDMVKITRPEGPHYFVRKSDIRYLEESG